jgi:hypothetical protein
MALSLPGLDAVQRARYSARLEEIRAAMPKKDKNKDTVAGDSRNGGNSRY